VLSRLGGSVQSGALLAYSRSTSKTTAAKSCVIIGTRMSALIPPRSSASSIAS
jgi:hypothetical protein